MTATALSCPKRNRNLVVLAAGLLLAGVGFAKTSDRTEIIHTSSVKTDATQGDKGVTILTGNVVMTQGTLKVTGNVAHLYMDADNNPIRAVVDGTPATFHEIDDNGNNVDGHATNIDYQISTSIATLTGDAWVKQQGRGEGHGDKLVYNTNTSNMTGESQGSNLVQMQFVPKAKPGAAPAAGTPAATPAPAATAPKKP
jgi:lipopolysaccharide export system protein LptA